MDRGRIYGTLEPSEQRADKRGSQKDKAPAKGNKGDQGWIVADEETRYSKPAPPKSPITPIIPEERWGRESSF